MKNQLLFIFVLNTLISFGQATLIKDINLGNNSSNPTYKTEFNNHIYFIANDGLTGNELWKTDGTEAGTILFKDFVAGEDSGMLNVKPFATSNNMYFFALENANTYLWKTDGTSAGTIKIKQFSSTSAYIYDEINGKLIFAADNGLWASDGTEAGTEKIANYTVFGNERFVKNGNILYFSAEASSSIGKELYKTDGTTTGTELVKDIRSGSSDSFPNQFITVNNITYFSANNGSNGVELWKTDGTAAGTEMVKDVSAGSASTFQFNSKVVALNNEIYFVKGSDLWKSDGKENGTIEIKTDLGIIKTLFIINNKILIIAYNSSTQKQVIWVSDGTAAGTTSFNPNYTEFAHNNQYTVVNDKLYFQAKSNLGYEIWVSDGTAAGTMLLKDVHPEADDNNIEDIVGLNDNVVFTGSDGNWLGHEIYISDGTTTGTKLLKDINQKGNRSSNAQNFFQLGNKILFSADNGENGRELWVLENETASLLKDINQGPSYSSPSSFVEVNGVAYFYASTVTNGKELWKTDGTEAGTMLVKDINAGKENGIVSNYLIALNNTLFFFANDGTNGSELWQSDGSEAGTILVKDINPGDANSMRSGEIFVFKNKIYFTANDATNGFELWNSDGTETGTSLFYDANSSGSGSPDSFIEFKEGLHFRASSSSGSKMYRTDGTNTFAVTDKGYSEMTVAGEYLYFVSTYSNGGELWATQSGVSPYQVKDIRPGSGGNNGSFPGFLTNHNGMLYFRANDGTNGYELWKSDGTSAGTTMIKNIGSGNDNVWISEMISFDNVVVFGGGLSSSSQELWKTDGTSDGTKLLQEINPSTEQFNSGSAPKNFFNSGNNLYFIANDGTIGSEPYVLAKETLSTNQTTLKETKVHIYPNPASNFVKVQVDNHKINSVSIFNILGKQIMHSVLKNNVLDVSSLPNGVYILLLKTDKQVFSKKIVKN